MRDFLLIAGVSAIFLAACASPPEPHERMRSSTTGTTLVRTGYVAEVRDVTIHDNSTSPAAPAIGALVGGVAGSMIGSGSGRAIAAIGGAAGGSVTAQQLAKPGSTTLKKVTVRFEDGELQTYDVSMEEPFKVGEPVKVVNRNGNILLTR